MIFDKKISGKCLRNGERVVESARRPVILWHGGVNRHGVSENCVANT